MRDIEFLDEVEGAESNEKDQKHNSQEKKELEYLREEIQQRAIEERFQIEREIMDEKDMKMMFRKKSELIKFLETTGYLKWKLQPYVLLLIGILLSFFLALMFYQAYLYSDKLRESDDRFLLVRDINMRLDQQMAIMNVIYELIAFNQGYLKSESFLKEESNLPIEEVVQLYIQERREFYNLTLNNLVKSEILTLESPVKRLPEHEIVLHTPVIPVIIFSDSKNETK